MPRTSRGWHRPAPPLLAPAGPPPLPSLAAVPSTLALFQPEAGLLDLARALVRARGIERRDGEPQGSMPGRMVQRAVERVLAPANRRAPGVLVLCAFIRPWADVLEEVLARPAAGERRWVLGIDCQDTHRLHVARLVGALGDVGAAVVLHRLVRHAPLCCGTAEDLQWIIDGWEPDGGGREAREIKRRAAEATELSGRLEGLLEVGRAAPLDVLAPGRIRRLVELLAALDRRAPRASDAAWRETDHVDWSLPRPVLQMVWEDGCPLGHALDEAEYVLGQDGAQSRPQQMWLLDPADPAAAARAWRRWVHALRQCGAVVRLVGALEALPGPTPPPA